MSKCSDLFWPRLDRESEKYKLELKESNEKAINEIEQANWKQISTILEEARRLAINEEDRRKSADTKATIYLVVLTAVIPLLATLMKDFPNSFQANENWQLTILAILLVWAMCYMVAAGIWAFRTIQVSSKHRVDVDELIKLDGHNQIDVALCKEILKSVRKNRDIVNKKISKMTLAHKFLVRTFVLFVFLLFWIGYLAIYSLFC